MMKTPIKLADGTELTWQSAEENGIEVTLYGEDFADQVDGSGYVVNFPLTMTPVEVYLAGLNAIEMFNFFSLQCFTLVTFSKNKPCM